MNSSTSGRLAGCEAAISTHCFRGGGELLESIPALEDVEEFPVGFERG